VGQQRRGTRKSLDSLVQVKYLLKKYDNEKSKIKENAKNICPLTVSKEYKEIGPSDVSSL